MSTQTPRRRPRTPPPSGPSTLQTIALAVGVVAVGLAIGAGLSLVAHRTVAVAAASPQPSPLVLATQLEPVFTPHPVRVRQMRWTPSPQPSRLPSSTPSPEPADSLTPEGTQSPAASPESSAAELSSPGAGVMPDTDGDETPQPALTPSLTAAPATPAAQQQALKPPARRAATLARPIVIDVDSPDARLAANVVRGYLEALIGGDEGTAYSALGGTAGEKGGTLSEEEFIDRSSRIKSIYAHQIGPGTTKVECEVIGAGGLYYDTFVVASNDRGVLITAHDYIKP